MFENQTKVIEKRKLKDCKVIWSKDGGKRTWSWKIEERIFRTKIKIEVLENKIIEHTSDPKEFECKYCRKRCQSKSDLSVQIKSIHEENLNQSENEEVASQNQPPKQVRLSCKTFFRYVKDENDLKFHMINEHGQKLFFASGDKKQSTVTSYLTR